MAKRNVISHLQIIRTWAAVDGESGCGIDPRCYWKIVSWIDDAIALLKAQEPKFVVSETRRTLQDDSYDEATYANEVFYSCPTCGKRFSRQYPDKNIKYCSACGQAVKWDG